MNYREIGTTGVKVSEVSLGCWTMGGLNWVNGSANGWADVNEDEVTAAVKAAVDAGVNHFDNADVYGNGRAERMLARVLRRLGLRSEDFVIASKVGHFPGTAEHAYEPGHIRHQCEQSLVNLGRDCIDIYYLHHGDFGPGDRYLAGAAEALDGLVRAGKVRLKGQSAYSAADFAKAVPVVRPSVLQSWANAFDDQFIRPDGPVGRLMAEQGLSFVAFSPLAQGLLLGKYQPGQAPSFEPGDFRRGNPAFSEENLARLAPKIARLQERFGPRAEDLAAMAIHYLLANPRVCCAIAGFRNERQVRCNLAGVGRGLSAEDIAFIRAAAQGNS
jgi:aryl-alcohol dehydrogenase-like predicted oxidoreductase